MQESAPIQETRIAADIEALRARCQDTRELYREVCALLFFRYGITPTANRLYQYVRKGSMSTPAQVLSAFWDELRARARVRIDHPGLPEELRETAAELVLQLWDKARHSAADSLAERSAGLERTVRGAQEAARAAEHRADTLEIQLAGAMERIARLEAEAGRERDAAGTLGRELATARGRLASMGEMLVDQGETLRQLRAELGAAQTEIARMHGEADALRARLTQHPEGGG